MNEITGGSCTLEGAKVLAEVANIASVGNAGGAVYLHKISLSSPGDCMSPRIYVLSPQQTPYSAISAIPEGSWNCDGTVGFMDEEVTEESYSVEVIVFSVLFKRQGSSHFFGVVDGVDFRTVSVDFSEGDWTIVSDTVVTQE